MSSEQENAIWQRLLETEGEWGMWRRALRSPAFRLYCRHWPYDDTEPVLQLNGGDYYDERSSQEPERIAKEWDFEIALSYLTPRQRTIAELVGTGMKPRDIAERLREPNTMAIRWVKWSLKKKWRVQ